MQWISTQSVETCLILAITPFTLLTIAAAPSVVTDLHFFQSMQLSVKYLFIVPKMFSAFALTPTGLQKKENAEKVVIFPHLETCKKLSTELLS